MREREEEEEDNRERWIQREWKKGRKRERGGEGVKEDNAIGT